MYFLIVLAIFQIVKSEIATDLNELNVFNLTEVLTKLLTKDSTVRLQSLKDKIETINKYVVDKDKMADLIQNVTKYSNLTETSFFKALNEKDDLNFKFEDDKNLYLKLKEKINRDDVLNILSKGDKNMVKSARKMMGGKLNDDDIHDNDVVDEFIAEAPHDDHKFEHKGNESIYWDPQGELEDLKAHHQHDGRRIFKGERTTVRYYPFMASVHVMGRFWCGGAIYWHDLVLTSAACLQLMHNNRFFRENPRVLHVRIGSNHSRIGGEIIEALEVYFNPGYDPKSLRNNIAIIRLRRHLYFNYHKIPKIIAISHNNMGMPATAEVTLLGWGVSKMSQKLAYEPIYLQRKVLPVYPNKFCQEVYGEKFITNTMFCAGTLTTGEGACDHDAEGPAMLAGKLVGIISFGSAVCGFPNASNHDAGGPAIFAGKLVGIISFGPAVCGFPNAPTVFTLVGAFADWIETVNETMPSYYRGRKRTTTSTRSPVLDIVDNWHINPKEMVPGLNPVLVDNIPESTPVFRMVNHPDTREDGWSIDEN